MKNPWEMAVRRRLRSVAVHTLLVSVAITCLFPLAWMVVSAMKTQETIFSDMSLWPTSPQWHNFVEAWTRGAFGMFFFNSLFYTIAVVTGVLVVSSLAAYAFAKLDFPLKKVFFYMLLATMMIPVPGAFIALYVLIMKLKTGTMGALDQLSSLGILAPQASQMFEPWLMRILYVLPQVNGGLALGVFLLKTFFEKIPRDLEDAATVDGCNKFQVFWNVALPLARPAIAVLAIFTTLGVWNEYLLAMLILGEKSLMPLQRGLMVFQGAHLTNYPLLMAGMTISVVPILIVYIVMQKHIISGIMAGALKA